MTHSPSENLKWLAHQYVLGELDAHAQEVFEARLAVDEEAAAAMASAVQVLAVIKASSLTSIDAPSRNESAVAGWRLAVGIFAMAAALSAVWLIPSSRDRANGFSEVADLVAMWSETSPEALSVIEADRDDESSGSDEVPDWLLAAVTIEAGETVREKVLEN